MSICHIKNCFYVLIYTDFMLDDLTGIVELDFVSLNNTCLGFNSSSFWVQGNHQLYSHGQIRVDTSIL